jgi:predicted RNA-binding protein with TRAM domain
MRKVTVSTSSFGSDGRTVHRMFVILVHGAEATKEVIIM